MAHKVIESGQFPQRIPLLAQIFCPASRRGFMEVNVSCNPIPTCKLFQILTQLNSTVYFRHLGFFGTFNSIITNNGRGFRRPQMI